MEKEIYDTYYLYDKKQRLLLVSPKLENVKKFINDTVDLGKNISMSVDGEIKITTKCQYTVTDKLWKNITNQK